MRGLGLLSNGLVTLAIGASVTYFGIKGHSEQSGRISRADQVGVSRPYEITTVAGSLIPVLVHQ